MVTIAINSATVLVSTAVGGYMVEIARASASSGRLTSVRNAVEQGSYVISGVASGYLAGLRFGWTPITCGAVAFLIVPVALWCLNEAPAVQQSSRHIFKAAGDKLARVGTAKALWMAAGVSFLFYFAPGIQTAQFYSQQNDLHMTTQQQGMLVSLGGVFGVLAAFLYGAYAAKRFALRRLLLACIIIGASAQAVYRLLLFLSRIARFIDSFNGFGFTLAEVAHDAPGRACHPGGLRVTGIRHHDGRAQFRAVWRGLDGAALQDHFHLSFHTLALINGAGSLLAIPLVLLVPAAIVMGRDGDKADRAGHGAQQPPCNSQRNRLI